VDRLQGARAAGSPEWLQLGCGNLLDVRERNAVSFEKDTPRAAPARTARQRRQRVRRAGNSIRAIGT
jgi:hypothetical protein